jgi:hypothetical protein
MLDLKVKPEVPQRQTFQRRLNNDPSGSPVRYQDQLVGRSLPLTSTARHFSRRFTDDSLDSIKKKDANGNDIAFDKDLGSLIEALPQGSQLKTSLEAAIGDATATVHHVEKRVGDWFDGMMERATGAYKRWMSTFSLIIGFVLAVAFNCDTLHVADSLAKSPTLRAAIEKVAEDVTNRCTGFDGKPVSSDAACKDARQNLEALQALPIGGDRTISPMSLAGWLITGIAVSLGAPFWFDLLSKFMNVRSSFKKEEKPA